MTNTKQTLGELVQQTLDGNVDGLEVYIHLKDLEKYLKDCISATEDAAFQTADRFNEKTFKYKGAEIQKKNSAGRYDFSGVALWKEAEKRKKELEELSKVAAKSKATVVDEISGEVVEPAIYTEGKAIISIKILN